MRRHCIRVSEASGVWRSKTGLLLSSPQSAPPVFCILPLTVILNLFVSRGSHKCPVSVLDWLDIIATSVRLALSSHLLTLLAQIGCKHFISISFLYQPQCLQLMLELTWYRRKIRVSAWLVAANLPINVADIEISAKTESNTPVSCLVSSHQPSPSRLVLVVHFCWGSPPDWGGQGQQGWCWPGTCYTLSHTAPQ